MSEPARTTKQRAIVNLILEAADRGEFLTVTDIANAIPHKAAYGSVRTSLRFLVKHGILVREPAGKFNLMKPTLKAYEEFRRR